MRSDWEQLTMRHSHSVRCSPLVALAICALVAGGCAGLPRIDPSGERFFICPKKEQAAVASTVGNPQVAPVYTDPYFPQPISPPSGVVPATAILPTSPTVAPETLSLTPDRVLAPVGSEVILKAGICTDDNYLVTHQKVEWLIARESAGEIVTLGGKGFCRDPLLPWNKPKKIDNQYAIGYTAQVPLTIDRGTSDTTDDVQIEPGHAWASITSPVEGTSHVTAVAPVVSGWPQRRSNATIYWVDAAWTFPPPAISSGGSQILSTTVRRQTDGTPLPGWVVRYDVAAGSGALRGGESSQTVEVATGADGVASVDVTPTGSTGTATNVAIQVIRPAGLNASDMPRLVVANGATNISWNGNSYLPPADDLGDIMPTTPIPQGGTSSQPVTPITPQPTNTARPILDLEILGEETGQVGGQAEYEVVIRNTGTAPATGISVNDKFGEGFRHPGDTLSTRNIDKTLSITLAPGQSHTETIQFEIVRGGNICHDVIVRCREGAEVSKRACMNVAQPAVVPQAGMEVSKDGPRLSTVGETALFTLSVKNTGEVPLENVEIIDEYDTVFTAQPRTANYVIIRNPDNKPRFQWRIQTLQVGETQRFEVECVCKAPKQRACSLAKVSAEGGPGVGIVPTADDHCTEIVESRRPGDAGPADVVPPAGAAATGLRLSISPYNKKPLSGSRATYQFFVENNTPNTEKQVQLSVSFPPEIVPDMATLQADVAGQLVGNELRFNPIAELRANERRSYTVTTSVLRAGIVDVVATVTSQTNPQGVQKTEQVEIVGF